MRAAGVDGRVGGGQGAEQLGERGLAGVVEVVLAAEEDDLVRQQRRADVRHGARVEVAAEADPLDDGADAAADLVDVDLGRVAGLGVEGDGHAISSLVFVNRLTRD